MKKVIVISLAFLLSACQSYKSGYDWFSAEVMNDPTVLSDQEKEAINKAKWDKIEKDRLQAIEDYNKALEEATAEKRAKEKKEEDERYQKASDENQKISKLDFDSTLIEVLSAYSHRCRVKATRYPGNRTTQYLTCQSLFGVTTRYTFENNRMVKIED